MELVDSMTGVVARHSARGDGPQARFGGTAKAHPSPRRALRSAPAPRDLDQAQTLPTTLVENGRTVWRIQCGDMIKRDRSVTVFVDAGEVVVIGPPGETARLSGNEVSQLRAALNEAASLAERER